MTEAEKVVLIRVIAEEVEDIVKGKPTSGPQTILQRLRRFTEQYENNPPEMPLIDGMRQIVDGNRS
jgi:hypothetical protein